jgi:hypothetical protein
MRVRRLLVSALIMMGTQHQAEAILPTQVSPDDLSRLRGAKLLERPVSAAPLGHMLGVLESSAHECGA